MAPGVLVGELNVLATALKNGEDEHRDETF